MAWKIKEPGGVNSAKHKSISMQLASTKNLSAEQAVSKPCRPQIGYAKASSLEDITEDDAYKRQLPTFDNALVKKIPNTSSALIAPYVRIPIISFFSTRDRVSALINGELRGLLESVLFEPLRWTPETALRDGRFVPAKDDSLIGAPAGLLANELEHALRGDPYRTAHTSSSRRSSLT